jgi:hypothetical protein
VRGRKPWELLLSLLVHGVALLKGSFGQGKGYSVIRSGSITLSSVIPGLVPRIHVDGRVKPGHDEEGADSTRMDTALIGASGLASGGRERPIGSGTSSQARDLQTYRRMRSTSSWVRRSLVRS